jgi:AcrR family transcriptional regulator
MPKVMPEYLEQRRQQILDAAAVCFSRRGFHPTTMQDICREAELSPGAVYRYFPSKESIIQAMCERGQGADIQAIDEAMQRGQTLEVLEDLIQRFFVELDGLHSQTHCALNLELIVEAPRDDHIRAWLTQSLSGIRGLFVELIAAGQARGEVNASLDSESVAQVMVALYHGFITQKLIDPEMNVERYADILGSLFGGTFWLGAAPDDRAEREGVVRHNIS